MGNIIANVAKYKSSQYQFPDRRIDPRKKGKEYCRKNAEAIYALYLRGKTAFPQDSQNTFNELRLYANGQQSRDQYKSWLLQDNSENSSGAGTWDDTVLNRVAKREGWYNVLWDNISPAPKIMSMLHGLFDDTEWDIFVDNIDQHSQDLLEHEKYKMIVQGQHEDWQIEYKKNAGIPIDEGVVYPKSKEEFDMAVASEGFKLNIAKAMEKLIEHSFEVSRWSDVIKKKLVDDLAAIGYGATRDIYDPEDGFFKTQYRDIARIVMQYSSESDYNDSEYAGYFGYITVSRLRQKRPDLREEEIKKLAYAHLGYYDNPTDKGDWEAFFSQIDPLTNAYRYDEFKVPTFEAEWIDTDSEKRVEVTNVHGKKTYVKKDFDEEVKPLSKKQKARGAAQEVKYTEKRVPYQCTWVIGSDIAFDCGRVHIAPRPQPSKPRLTFHVEQLMQPSYIRQLKPILDNIQIIWLRWQNSLAKMIERGYAINVQMLMNISDGEKKWKLGDVIKMWKQTGVMPFMQSVSGGYQGGDVTPVREIAGGLGSRLEETIAAFEYEFRLIEDIVGFNPASLGSTPETGAAVRNVQAAMQSTNNVVKPLMKAVMEVKAGVAESLMSRLQIAIRANEYIRKSYSGVVSKTDIKIMQLAEKDQVKYGLSMKPRPDANFRAQLSEYVKAAVQSGRDGGVGLEMPEAMLIEEQLYRGINVTEIRQQISYMLSKNKEQAQQEKMAAIDRQNQGLQAVEQQKQQADAQKLQAEAQLDSNKIQAEGNIDMAMKRRDNNHQFLMKLVEAANVDKEGMPNTEAKRRLSLALRVIAEKGMDGVDLPQALGQAEAYMDMSEGMPQEGPTASIQGQEGTISPNMV